MRALLPDVYALIRPRRALLGAGLVLVAINRVSGLVLPASTKVLIDDVLGRQDRALLLPLIGAVLAATCVQGLTSYALTQIVSKSAQRLIAELRLKAHAHVIRLPLEYFDRQSSGTLVARVMSDVEGLRNLVGTGLIDFVGGVLTAILAFAVLLTISPLMTLVAVVFIAALGRSLFASFRRVRPVFRMRSKIYGEVSGRLTESLGGVRVVKGYRAEGQEQERFAQGIQRLLDNVIESLSITSLMSLKSSVALGLVGALTMYLGATRIMDGTLTLGGFVTFSLFLGFLVAPVSQIASVGTQMTEALAGIERMKEVTGLRREGEDEKRTVEIPPILGEVRFEDVSFEYDAGRRVLDGISFVAKPGTVTALVGRSGAGKSTIASLIALFYEPTDGAVLVDGVDLKTVTLDSYRKQLGFVLQETFLFDGSVRENVLFARPDATEGELHEACKAAHVDEFVGRLPQGYDTIVGERGVKLSGGQRQRMAIARALLANPRILILDEATASLDSESEQLIQRGLAELMRHRTSFVIAHRLSTVQRADQILVMESGRIVERGTHKELLAAGGLYSEMVALQR